MSLVTFFSEHPLFHYDELLAYLKSLGDFNKNTLDAGLQYHLSKKHLIRIRRGYYVVASDYMPGVNVESDQLLIAGCMTPDAIINYHTAMEFHALAYSVGSVVYFNSNETIGRLVQSGGEYQQVAHPGALKPNDIYLETKLHDRVGMNIRVATIERTLVDCLQRPTLAGGWEEIWRSFESINFLDVERVIRYALRLSNATTIAKLGFFLEQHQAQFSVKKEELEQLARRKPQSRHYMDKHHQGPVKNVPQWNLIVPLTIIEKSWEEPTHDIV